MFVPSEIRPAAYQLVALTKVLENGLGGVLVADGVGVGKTISAAYVALYSTRWLSKPAFVICPPTLIPKWIEELRSKFDLRAFPVRSEEDLETARAESKVATSKIPVYVMSNSLLTRVETELYPEMSVVIFDEIHTYRNRDTQAFGACSKLSQLAKFRIGLTATPINNSLDDLVSELNIILPMFEWNGLQAALEEIWRFDRRILTAPFVTRFTKDKLGIQFATRQVRADAVRYPPGYVQRARELISRVHNKRGSGTFYEQVTYYRMAASSPYAFFKSFSSSEWKEHADPKLDCLQEILSKEGLSQWLIFCEFADTVFYLEQNLQGWNCFTLTGETPMDERQSIIEAFKRTPNSVLVMTSVGSEGLDLQFCNGIVNYDIHWNPMRLEQRIGRVDRVGQKKDRVLVYNIVVDGSVDERVVRVVIKKLRLIQESVFSPGQILGNLPKRVRGQLMFDQDSLAMEINESERLLTSLRSTTQVQSTDYDVLPLINPEFCLPANLSQSVSKWPGQTIWLQPEAQESKWLAEVRSKPEEIKRLVKYYA